MAILANQPSARKFKSYKSGQSATERVAQLRFQDCTADSMFRYRSDAALLAGTERGASSVILANGLVVHQHYA
jgi:hypothetical protein